MVLQTLNTLCRYFFFTENKRRDRHKEHIETSVSGKKRNLETSMKDRTKKWEVSNKLLKRKIISVTDKTAVLSGTQNSYKCTTQSSM